MDRGKEPSVFADSHEIPLKRSAEQVLCQQLRKHRQVASLLGKRTDELNFLSHDLQKYISRKEDTISKSSLDELKAKILEGQSAALLALAKYSGLPSDKRQSDANFKPRNRKRHKIDDQGVDAESIEQSSPYLAHDATTGGNIKSSNAYAENEIQNITQLSTTDCLDVETEPLPASCNNTNLSGKKSSGLFPNLQETNIVHANAVGSEANSVRELSQNNMCNLPRDTSIIDAGYSQLPRQTLVTAAVNKSSKILQQDSPNLQNPMNISEKSHGVSLRTTYDEFLCENRKNMSRSLDEHFNNHEASFLPEVPIEDDGTYDIPAKLHLVSDMRSNYLSSFQAHVGNLSVSGDWAGKGFCMECLKDGASLTCKSCLFAFHESCLDSLARLKSSSHFYCPFCSYKVAAKTLQKALKETKRSWKMFRALTRMDVLQVLQKRPSSAQVLQEPNLETAKGIGNTKMNATIDQHQRCKTYEISGEKNEQNGQMEATLIGDTMNYPSSSRVNLARDAEYSVFNSEAEADAGRGNEVAFSILQDSNPATLNRQNALGNNVEPIELTHCHNQVEHHVAIYNNCSLHKRGPSRVGEVHDVSIAEQEKVVSPENDQPNLSHLENAEQSQAAHDGKTTSCESEGEKHAKRRRQDELIDNIPHPMLTLDVHVGTRASTSNQRRYRIQRYSNPIAPKGRRKYLPWTEEEEQALVEAMEEVTAENAGSTVKRFPWSKVLELGRGKFHRTRLPSDLKDKWRNMNRKKDEIKNDKSGE